MACAVAVIVIGMARVASANSTGPACSQQVVKSRRGIVMQILFARNGAVQQYRPMQGRQNTEATNDMRIALQKKYGPAGVDAPPVRIISFKSDGSGGMMIPDKAIDSCGRTLTFN